MGKSLKLVNDESVDEESFGSVIWQVRSEARALQHSNAWVTSRRISQSSKPVLHSSTCEVTKKSLSLTQATLHTEETNRPLAVKLQHRHGSSELIKLLHDHGFIVSYDEGFRF